MSKGPDKLLFPIAVGRIYPATQFKTVEASNLNAFTREHAGVELANFIYENCSGDMVGELLHQLKARCETPEMDGDIICPKCGSVRKLRYRHGEICGLCGHPEGGSNPQHD